ncbi:GTP-binding protein, partial [Bacillus licheniformis]|uniref:GTP-binding protein n=1 Tax=Bacillus licheniformis TaxID=1402 RepID=UPI0011A11994
MPLTVLTAYLPSRKTTLLQHLLHQPHPFKIPLTLNHITHINIHPSLLKKAHLIPTHQNLLQIHNPSISSTLTHHL